MRSIVLGHADRAWEKAQAALSTGMIDERLACDIGWLMVSISYVTTEGRMRLATESFRLEDYSLVTMPGGGPWPCAHGALRPLGFAGQGGKGKPKCKTRQQQKQRRSHYGRSLTKLKGSCKKCVG